MFLSHLLLLAVWNVLGSLSVQTTPRLVLPEERTTGLGCIPEGRTVSYQCTVTDTGIGSTVWLGSAFDCPSSLSAANNRITLPHSAYSSGAMGTCGDLSAMSVGFSDGVNYTSRLTFTATTELNGTTIDCTVSAVIQVGSDTIRVGVIPSPPQMITITFPDPSFLTVSWGPPSDPGSVGEYLYMFGVTGEGCGDCVSMNDSAVTTSVTCSGWTAVGQTCSFEVRTLSQDCGFISEPVVESISLTTPSPPSQLKLEMLNLTCKLQSSNIVVTWSAPSLGAKVPNVSFYQVAVANRTGTVHSDTTVNLTMTIPGSVLPGAGEYSFNVTARNFFGESQAAMRDMNVSATGVTSAINATLSGVSLEISLSSSGCFGAEISVYYQICPRGQCPCPDYFVTNVITENISMITVTVDVHVSADLTNDAFCYWSEVRNDGVVVGFEGSRMFPLESPNPRAVPEISGWLIPTVIVIAIVLLVGATVVTLYKRGNLVQGDECLENQKQSSLSPGPDSLYADPNTINHETTATGEEYAIVAKKSKKDITAIEHETTVTGNIYMYAVVDKPKIESPEKREPDVVPPDNKEEEGLISKSSSPPGPDSLYADPNTIEHETTPTGVQYAIVDKKSKKDITTIEHETAPSGDMYAVVDKPKRGSSKKREHDVVPAGTEGCRRADQSSSQTEMKTPTTTFVYEDPDIADPQTERNLAYGHVQF